MTDEKKRAVIYDAIVNASLSNSSPTPKLRVKRITLSLPEIADTIQRQRAEIRRLSEQYREMKKAL